MSACVSFVGVLFYEWLPAGRAGMLRAASTEAWSLEVLMSKPWDGRSGEDALEPPWQGGARVGIR